MKVHPAHPDQQAFLFEFDAPTDATSVTCASNAASPTFRGAANGATGFAAKPHDLEPEDNPRDRPDTASHMALDTETTPPIDPETHPTSSSETTLLENVETDPAVTEPDAHVADPEGAPAPAVFKPDIMFVDIAGLGYAAMYTPAGKLAHEGFPTGAIHGALASLFARMSQRPGAVPVILWDNKAHWRHEMLPEYKATRGADPAKQAIRDQYRLQVPYLQLLLTLMGIPQVSCGGSEADDLAGAVCRELDPSWNIELVTRDTDWWQQLDERTTWYSPVHRKGLSLALLADPDNGMRDGHFLSTNEYLEAKALAGDSSDEIPGIVGVGLPTACKIIRQHGTSIRDFWSKVDSGEVKPKGIVMTRVADAESRAIFERNVKLMDWREAPALQMWSLALTAGKPDFAQLEAEASCLGLKKLVDNAKTALKPWKNGWGKALDAVDAALHHQLCLPVLKA